MFTLFDTGVYTYKVQIYIFQDVLYINKYNIPKNPFSPAKTNKTTNKKLPNLKSPDKL